MGDISGKQCYPFTIRGNREFGVESGHCKLHGSHTGPGGLAGTRSRSSFLFERVCVSRVRVLATGAVTAAAAATGDYYYRRYPSPLRIGVFFRSCFYCYYILNIYIYIHRHCVYIGMRWVVLGSHTDLNAGIQGVPMRAANVRHGLVIVVVSINRPVFINISTVQHTISGRVLLIRTRMLITRDLNINRLFKICVISIAFV